MQWLPIDENTPTNEPILVWVPEIHRGFDSAEVVVMFRNEEGKPDWWTNGGSNGGDDLHFEIEPTHWMPLPDPPADWKPEGFIVPPVMGEEE